MAEQDYNDEYQFKDPDAFNPDATDINSEFEDYPKETERRPVAGERNIRRNAFIAIGVIVLIMLLYKFIGAYFSGKKATVEQTTPAPKPTVIQQPKPVVKPTVQPVKPVMPATTSSDVNTVRKLSALELSQQNMRSEITSLNNQINGISSNVSELASQVAELNRMLSGLATKMEEQSREIERIIVRSKPKPPPKIVRKVVVPRKQYFIQAVIPGRAWLIASNGTTLTVREGTTVPGYGVVKLIDPYQGRVLTSSGQVIRFSQEDS